MRTPERNPARKRKTDFDHDASQKRLSMDLEEDVASIGDNVGVDMMFDDDGPSGAGGVVEDTMMGMFTELNIVDITEVFFPLRVVMQGINIGWKAGSSMDLLTGWNFELKSDRDRAIKQIDEESPCLSSDHPRAHTSRCCRNSTSST